MVVDIVIVFINFFVCIDCEWLFFYGVSGGVNVGYEYWFIVFDFLMYEEYVECLNDFLWSILWRSVLFFLVVWWCVLFLKIGRFRCVVLWSCCIIIFLGDVGWLWLVERMVVKLLLVKWCYFRGWFGMFELVILGLVCMVSLVIVCGCVRCMKCVVLVLRCLKVVVWYVVMLVLCIRLMMVVLKLILILICFRCLMLRNYVVGCCWFICCVGCYVLCLRLLVCVLSVCKVLVRWMWLLKVWWWVCVSMMFVLCCVMIIVCCGMVLMWFVVMVGM